MSARIANKTSRYLALDVLRGMTIALMVLVNTPGSWSSIYAPFKHAAWHGFTLTDLVFPTFLFVVGNAMSFSFKKFKAEDSGFWKKVLSRTALIFIIGLLLNAFPFITLENGELVLKDLTQIRIMGVLQRIALCYFLASVIVKFLNWKAISLVSFILLTGYWAIMYFFDDHPHPYTLENNAALKFDLLIFSPENLWSGFGKTFDPEGLLSTIPATVNVLAGFLCGKFIQKYGNSKKTFAWLFTAGMALLTIGLIWDIWFPINKGIWTSSFVVFSTGWDLLIIALLILIIELLDFRKWTYFFQAFGRNPLFIFILSGVIIKLIILIKIGESSLKSVIYERFYLSWLSPINASLVFAISYMLLLWLIGYWMDKKKIYIKV
ncbi:DUF1624 domain-containing protein [Gramella sp. BOM4]|nr:DUF1624 domain-containing protein [Christiangramia bathymodioli]